MFEKAQVLTQVMYLAGRWAQFDDMNEGLNGSTIMAGQPTNPPSNVPTQK